jgi:hypothetical protein
VEQVGRQVTPIGAIWHYPGTKGESARDLPVAIIGFLNDPGQTMLGWPKEGLVVGDVATRALAVDTTGHIWAIPTNLLTVTDADVTAKLAAIPHPG